MKFLSLIACSLLFTSVLRADLVLVDNGQPRAQIVIAEQPQRSVRGAAQELQDYVAKISGARLPIVTKPAAGAVKVFVGRSAETDALKVTPTDLRAGAYRIVSGADWLALVGDDTDFAPVGPWAKGYEEIRNGWLQGEWEKLTGLPYRAPNSGSYKERLKLPAGTGLPEGTAANPKESFQMWDYDERGSYNAVCGLLMKLGVRWYLPGALGEVVPALQTIALPKIDETTRPDFPVRQVNFRSAVNPEAGIWGMHLGLRDEPKMTIAHGLARMTNDPKIHALHPDWFAMYGGRRPFDPHDEKNQLCYSNEEFFRETVRYARAQFDVYHLDAVSIMPPDGFSAPCQCELCKGKDDPERGRRGLASDYVWDFVNRVAKEVRKTHPDKKIVNCAYGIYTLPPLRIDKLEPNVVVCIVGGRRPLDDQPDEQAELQKLREAWAAKSAHPILIFENYPLTERGWYLPSYVAHSIAAGIDASRGLSQGEDIWVSSANFTAKDLGFNHFMVYFTARLYWSGKGADVDALLREYCRLFYGPAEAEMLAFFAYGEANWREIEKDKEKADRVLALFDQAKQKVVPDSIYAKRLALVDDYLASLRRKSLLLGKARGTVPIVRLVGKAHDIVIDGRLDEEYWKNTPGSATGKLRELHTGRRPIFGTSVQTGWKDNDLYVAIRCDEHPGEKLNVTATRADDSALWHGDAVEILLETDSHSYYQIAISPNGQIADLDRSAAKDGWFKWDSKAEVATQIADDHWTAEIRIPVTPDENDPLHEVIGRKPTQSLPWHINVCRQRIREGGAELSALSPTGTAQFHDTMKFAYFYAGNSNVFPAAEPEGDYFTDYRAAEKLARGQTRPEAQAAFIELAERKLTDFQKSAALEQAATCARIARQHEVATEITARIPIDAVKKTAQMQNLLAERKLPELVQRFGQEDIGAWPFWQRGEGFRTRAEAYRLTKADKAAEADLTNALAWTGDPKAREAINLALTQIRKDTPP